MRAQELGEARARVVRTDGVLAPVDDERRAADAVDQFPHARLVWQSWRDLGGDERLWVRLQRPADRVLDAAWSSAAR